MIGFDSDRWRKVTFLSEGGGKFSVSAWASLVQEVLAESNLVLQECEQFKQNEISRFSK